MLLTKLQTMTAVLLAATLVGVCTAVAVGSMPGKEVHAPMETDKAKAAPTKAAEEAAPDAEEKAVREYVAELRAAVKHLADDKHIYGLVIDPRFRMAVTWAARHGDDALVVELMRDYRGPNKPDMGGTSLTSVAWMPYEEVVKILLDRKVDVNARDAEGRSALHYAAGQNVKTTQLLLDHGANVNVRDNNGRTELMIAAENGRLDVAKALLAEGANVRLKNKEGKTALDLVKPNVCMTTARWRSQEAEKEWQAQVERDAKTLRVLLERAGGAMP